MKGAGKYDDLTTTVTEATEADAVVLLVLGGNKGSGFSVQATEEAAFALPDLLESIAKEMRKDLATETH